MQVSLTDKVQQFHLFQASELEKLPKQPDNLHVLLQNGSLDRYNQLDRVKKNFDRKITSLQEDLAIWREGKKSAKNPLADRDYQQINEKLQKRQRLVKTASIISYVVAILAFASAIALFLLCPPSILVPGLALMGIGAVAAWMGHMADESSTHHRWQIQKISDKNFRRFVKDVGDTDTDEKFYISEHSYRKDSELHGIYKKYANAVLDLPHKSL